LNDKKLMKKDAVSNQHQESTPKKGGAQIRNLRNFGITLGISFVILGIVAIFAARFVANTVCEVFTGDGAKDLSEVLTPVETTDPSGEKQDDRFSKELSGSSFTWLMVITDKRPSVYDNYFPDKNEIKNINEEDAFGLLGKNYRYVGTAGIVLVHANVNLREYTVMAIPPITRVETGSGDYSLSEIYSYFGMDFLKSKIEGLTGMTVDQYTVLNCTDLVSLANVIGGIDCKIPVDIYSNGPLYVSKPPEKSDTEEDEAASEDAPVYKAELEKTEVAKLSAKLEAALLYSDYTDGVGDEMTILQSFAQGVLKNLSKTSESGLLSYYEGLKNKFRESSLDQSVVKDAAEVIQAYSWLEVQTLVYPGRFVPAKGSQGAYYNPDVEGAVQYFYKYR
jgi:anionic cell wall polymer biosynthesis LytR-Cps2A-Psr (LCP) family protein